MASNDPDSESKPFLNISTGAGHTAVADDSSEDTSDDPHEHLSVPTRQTLLSSSVSVPLFNSGADDHDNDDEEGGSENDVSRLGQTVGLQMSQSYGQDHVQQHKVQFLENTSHVTRRNFDQRSPLKRKRSRHRTLSENSATLSLRSSATSLSTNTDTLLPPDGGWGWVVVLASFFVNLIADGVTFSFGIMFEEFQTEFDSSAAETAGVVSVFHAVPLLTGPIATWLTDRYGCRTVTIVGSLLASAGFLAASFSHHIALLYLCFGVISGFGLSLCYVASIIIVAYYFETRRSFATGIAVCGSGIGTFLFAPFTQWLMDNYDGWRGACTILSAIFLNMIVCGMMFREMKWMKKISRTSSSRSITSQMPEIEELRQALESGDVSELINDKEEEVLVASSLLTIPTYIKDPSKLPEQVLVNIIENKQTYDFIVDNYPEALKDVNSCENIKQQQATESKKPEPESKSVKLKRRVSSLIKGGQKSILKKQVSADEDRAVKRRNPDKVEDLKTMKIRRQSMTFRKQNDPRVKKRVRSSSCPDIYKSLSTEDDDDDGGCSEIVESVHDCLMLHYVNLPFVVFCISNAILYFWYDVPYVYTIEYVENNLKIPNTKSTQILSVIGILNTVGEVAVGWLSDQKYISSIGLYAVCMLLCGLVTAIIPLISSFPIILSLSAGYGFCISANYSLTSPILVDLVSIQQFSSAYGLLLAFQGVANLLGPPFAGWLYDVSSEWYLTFALCGVFVAISGLSLLIIPTVHLIKNSVYNLNKKKKDCINASISPVSV